MNILIVNYNTQKLTSACIKSVNKHTPGTNIYVFDNSDKEPFVNEFENVTVFDNTSEKIINFNNLLEKCKANTSFGAESNFGTIKHASSVDKCFDLINDNFILLDSDVLLKTDITEIYDENYIYVGDTKKNCLSKKTRVSPHICFINVKEAKKNRIRYFDEKRIVGVSEEGDEYDTGSSFYYDCVGFKTKEIDEKKYIVHYGAGSWIKLAKTKKRSVEEWLKKYSYLCEKNKNDIDIFICTHKDFKKVVNNEVYKIIDTRDFNNSKYVLKDDFYSELLSYFYIADNIELKDYVGFCHYRRYFNFLDNIPDIDELFKSVDCVIAKPIVFRRTNKAQYASCHNIEDLYIIGGILADKYPEYTRAFKIVMNSKLFAPYNMFIMKRENFLEYIKFIKGVLDDYVEIVGTDITKRIENNKDKYLKKSYPNNTVEYQYRIGGYLAERLTNVFIINKFKKLKAYPVIVTEDKYKKDKNVDTIEEKQKLQENQK